MVEYEPDSDLRDTKQAPLERGAKPPARSAAVFSAVESGRGVPFLRPLFWSAALRAGGNDALSHLCEAPSRT
jgi:hypothetical protein